ncbi:MAG: DinB family protein [Candidatus Thorarchaeota archaeon]|jgi:uncharacterized damage-inducible protein DinB
MTEFVRTALKQGLVAFHIHPPPEKALKGLSSEIVTKRIDGGPHSIWDLLHHLLFWQDITIESLEEKEIDWERSKAENWPDEAEQVDKAKLEDFTKRFLDGIERISELADTVDLSSGMPSWPKATKMWAILMIAQHNSYHIGQIVTLRQMLETWPPPE